MKLLFYLIILPCFLAFSKQNANSANYMFTAQALNFMNLPYNTAEQSEAPTPIAVDIIESLNQSSTSLASPLCETNLSPLPAENHCSTPPRFLMNELTARDLRSLVIADITADRECSRIKLRNDFNTPLEFENYLRSKPAFSSLLNQPPVSACLKSQTSFPESKRNLLIAQYYNNFNRLRQSLTGSLQDISAIDHLIGRPILENVSCSKFQTSNLRSSCEKLKSCSAGENNLHSSAQDTIQAVKAIEKIEKELESQSISKNISELKERKKMYEQLYPWILGKKFKDGYDHEKTYSPEEMARLIKTQLSHTREKLVQNADQTIKVFDCVIHNQDCKQVRTRDADLALSKAPPLENIFTHGEKKETPPEELSSSDRTALKQNLIAESYFKQVQCREKIRQDTSYVRKELSLLALEAGLTVATVGLTSAAILGKLSLKLGGQVSKARRVQNLSLIGLDVGLSTIYIDEAVEQCRQDLNQLERLAGETASSSNQDSCRQIPLRSQHTSNLKSCLLTASLASLPITLPLLGAAGRAVFKGVKNPKKTTSELYSSSAVSRQQLAEQHLNRPITNKETLALRKAHLVGKNQPGADGSPARAGNYTFSQLKEKNSILSQAGFSKEEREILIREGITGIETNHISSIAIYQLPIKKFRKLSPDEIKQLSPNQIRDLTSKQVINLNKEQIQAFTPVQLRAFPTGSLIFLSKEQVKHLTNSQIKAFTPKQLQVVNSKLGSINDTTLEAMYDLDPVQLQAVIETQIRSLSPNQLTKVPPSVLQNLSPKYIENIAKNVELIRGLTGSQIQAMTPKQIRVLIANEHSNLKGQVQYLTFEQVQIVEDLLRPHTLKRMTRGQIRVLSLDFFRYQITPEHLRTLKPHHIRSFTKEQLQALPPEKIQNTPTISWLRQDQLRHLTPEQKETGLTKEILRQFNLKTFDPLTEPEDIALVLPEQIRELTDYQLRKITPLQLKALSTQHLKELSPEQAALLDPRQLKALSAEQKQALALTSPAS